MVELCGIRAWVWITWAFHALCSATYLGLAVTTANNIRRVDKYLVGSDGFQVYKNGLMAAVVLGIIIVMFFIIFSPLIILGKHFGASLTLSYGIMLGMCSHSAWFMLLSGLVLNSSIDLAKELYNSGNAYSLWSNSDYTAYQACFSFSYILTGTFCALFVVLFFGRRSLGEDTGGSAGGAGSKSMKFSGNSSTEMQPPAQWPPANPAGPGNGAWPTNGTSGSQHFGGTTV